MYDFAQGIKITTAMQGDKGSPHTTHCMLYNGYVMASNGVVSAGLQTDNALTCNPHSFTLNKALSAVDMTKSQFILMDDSTLLLRSGRQRIKIPCVSSEIITPVTPDNPIYLLPGGFLSGLYAIGAVVNENTELVLTSSVLLQENIAVAATNHLYAEFWHSMPLPKMVLPKQFLTLLEKTKLNPVSFGYSDHSFTVWFEGDAWLKTNLFNNSEYPNITKIAERVGQTREWFAAPEDFESNLKFISKFCEHGVVNLDSNVLTPTEGKKSASYDFEDLKGSGKFKIDDLLILSKLATHINLLGDEKGVYFCGNAVRGMIARMVG